MQVLLVINLIMLLSVERLRGALLQNSQRDI